jgi:hypothetical protein
MLLELLRESLLLLRGDRVQLAQLDVYLEGEVLKGPLVVLALGLFLEDLQLGRADVLGKLEDIRFLKVEKLDGDFALDKGVKIVLSHVLLVADLLEEGHEVVLHALGTLRVPLDANSDLHQILLGYPPIHGEVNIPQPDTSLADIGGDGLSCLIFDNIVLEVQRLDAVLGIDALDKETAAFIIYPIRREVQVLQT